jgi:hypothetical protein
MSHPTCRQCLRFRPPRHGHRPFARCRARAAYPMRGAAVRRHRGHRRFGLGRLIRSLCDSPDSHHLTGRFAAPTTSKAPWSPRKHDIGSSPTTPSLPLKPVTTQASHDPQLVPESDDLREPRAGPGAARRRLMEIFRGDNHIAPPSLGRSGSRSSTVALLARCSTRRVPANRAPLPLGTIGSSACAGGDEMTATPGQATTRVSEVAAAPRYGPCPCNT